MRRRLAALLLPLLVLAAGCLAPSASLDPAALARDGVLVVDAEGAPVPYAPFLLLAGGAPVLRGSSDAEGVIRVPAAAFDALHVEAAGHAPLVVAAAELGARLVLAPAAGAADPADATPILRFLPDHDFGAIALGPEAACAYRNTCGLSEPVVEVAGDGSIYVSSTCCIGASPPVWVSRDGGATWQALETPGVREAVGIEGDFAIDEAGNVYFTDILVGAMWLTSWDKDGNWRHTVPVPFEPLVDRPWVRAGAEDVVYFLYNTGSSTNFHVSRDGGLTFSPVPYKFPAALGTLGQGPERDHLWVVDGMRLYESTDGGATWGEPEEVPTPEADGGTFGNAVPVVDEAGRVLVAFDWGSDEEGFAVYASFREPDGTWRGPLAVSPEGATHHLPWPAAGPEGGFVVAWYGTDDGKAGPNSVAEDAEWYVLAAATHDAGGSWQSVRADPTPVATGPLNRRLLDFLQVDVAPDGAAHLVYAENRDGSNGERTHYARTTVGLGLAPLVFPHGPKDAAGAGGAPEGALARPILADG